MECHDSYEALERRSISAVDVAFFGWSGRSAYGYSRRRALLDVRSNAKTTRTLSFILALEDVFGGLSFARKKDSCTSANQFVQALKTFPWCLVTSFHWTTRHFTVLLVSELLSILSGQGCFLFLITPRIFESTKGVLSIVKSYDRCTGKIAEALSTR